MATAIPLDPSTPHYDVGVTLDGTPYIVEVKWSARDEAWYMTLRDEAGDPIWAGRKIVLGTALGHRSRDARRPPGALFAVDLSGAQRDATIDDLGTRVVVYYATAAEMIAELGEAPP